MNGNDVAFLTIRELAAAYRSRQLSPVEVVRNQLDRIDRLNPTVHAYLTIRADEALAAARRVEQRMSQGSFGGPLLGVPVSHKDIYWTRGIRTTAHSRILADFVPDADATVVARWRAAGVISLGKTNTHEFATGGMDWWGFTVNPHNTRLISAGSSSGAAVGLVTGLCYGASGTDTAGSIRTPASFCGLVGIKPTYGRVSRYGVIPLSWTLDHCGPMARSVADCALLLRSMAGYDSRDPTTARIPVPDYNAALREDLKGVRIGVPRSWFFDELHPETAAAMKDALQALQGLGAALLDVDIPHMPEAIEASSVVFSAESYSVHERWLAEKGELYGPLARRRFVQGGLFTAAEYLRSLRVRELFIREMERLFENVDALVTPATPEPAYPVELYGIYEKDIGRNTRTGNLSGIPCLVLPCGYTRDGLPIGMQVMGRWWDEAKVLSIGNAYERATPWHMRRPALALL